MARITDEEVSEMNDRIAQATTTAEAFRITGALTRTMVNKLIDLNGEDPDSFCGGLPIRRDWVAAAHGWDWNEWDDHRPADGHGPCDLGRFEAHSRRPTDCRRCGRRKIDHRRVISR